MIGLPQMGMICFISPIILFAQNIWIEKIHSDFIDGWEYYYLAGDTATLWNASLVRRWKLGGYVYSPATGGLRIIGRDWDLNNDGYLDVVLDWFQLGIARIYWNSANGFNTSNYTNLTGFSINPQGISLVDLNCDGYQDILIASYEPGKGSIFFGSASGYSSTPDDSVKYGPPYAQDMHPCDLNNDGYLDILVSGGTIVYIYPGPPPFSNTDPINTLNCPAGIASGINIADLDNNGSLDISVSHNQSGTIRIFWGPSFTSYQDLPSSANYDHSIADLNKDGFLDIVFAQNSDSSCIYWGSSTGYSIGNRTLLPGSGKGDISCEDVNNDGAIDISLSNRYDRTCSIWWGSQYQSRVRLPVVDGPMVINIADWNNDGFRDLLAGGIYGPTYLYWNSSIGFDSTRKFTFPDNCDDAIWEDLGNIWDRANKERYLSNTWDAGDTITVDSVKWWGNFPTGIVCSVWVRGALDTTSWERWVLLSNGGTDTLLTGKRYLQYRCTFSTDYKRTSQFSFDSIKVYYHSGPLVRLILEPNQADSTLPSVRIDYPIRVINIGIGLDTVDLVYQHTTNWQIDLFDSTGNNPLIDHNNNSIPDVIININDTVPIVLGVTPPSNAQGGEIDSLRLIGNSNINPALMDTVFITTKIRRVVAILVEPDQVGYTVAGVPRSYDLWVYNQGTNRDTVDLYYNHNRPWGVVLLDSLGMPLADHNNNGLVDLWVNNSDSVRFRLVIYSPDTASVGVADTLILTGRSSLNPAITDNARIITIIEGMGSIIIFPDQQLTG
ncbi:MAG: VCBS repeat-containing protein, partial [candidate division WOR-3 bacterium]